MEKEIESTLDYKNFEDGIWYVEKIPDGFSAGRLAKRLEDLPKAKFRFQFKKVKPEIYDALQSSGVLEEVNPVAVSKMFEIFSRIVEKRLFKTEQE
jgi:hypothetical protein